MRSRGYFGIAVIHSNYAVNIGTLMRSANIMGAKFIAVIGKKWKHQNSDTLKTYKHLPLYEFATFDEFYNAMPKSCQLIGVEIDSKARDLKGFEHPDRAIYLLGAEDNGIPQRILEECHHIIQLKGNHCLNVAVAGSIVMYHREGL